MVRRVQSRLVMRSAVLGLIGVLLGMTTAEASPARRPVFGARVGWNSTSLENEDDPGEFEPDGGGLLLDLSVGWKAQPWLSIALYGAYASLHDDYVHEYMGSHAEDDRFLELGARVSFHAYGAFAGIGVAATRIRRDYTMVHQTPARDLPDESHSDTATSPELHLGYTTPPIAALGGIAFQVFLVASKTGDFDSRRIAIGVEY
jgi:hypothetical protein